MHTCNDDLYTSDMQFGFKPQHSTTMCSLVYQEIINHYMSHNSNVYSYLLDANKALITFIMKIISYIIESKSSVLYYTIING